MKKLNVAIFIAILCAFVGIITFFPRDERVIHNENRNFNRFPELTADNVFSGGFGKQFDEWASDLVGYRADFIYASMSVVRASGISPPAMNPVASATPGPAQTPDTGHKDTPTAPAPTSAVVPAPSSSASPSAGASAGPDSTQSYTPAPAPEPEPEPEPEPLPVIQPEGAGILSGSTITFDDRIVSLFVRSLAHDEHYAEVINTYRAAVDESVRIFSLLVPTQISFLPEIYRELSDSQRDSIDYIYSSYSEGITAVDAYDALARRADEYIYYRTDHHWTALGAYYVYAEFARAAGFEPIGLDEYEVIEIPGFLGYLYNQAPSPALREKPDTIYAYKYIGDLETSAPLLQMAEVADQASYGLFLGGDRARITITTSVDNGRTAVVVKDSYANCFIPWLAPHYECIIVLDPRTYEGSVLDLLEQYDDADLIFFNYAMATVWGLMSKYILEIM